MPLVLIPSDGPSEQELAEIEAGLRAGIVTDFLAAQRAGDRLAAFAAEHLAERIDQSTPDGPRLTDELDALRHLAA
ncbi:hypothetical protein EAO70_06035 [Streptomyces sp. adm13(2018)]|uniref:hypothetical protein n=1 Tax=Streptomyces sp. adm13(2018) TaxID=2479007 RepID=UPI0011CD9477|nr:hypothetical protein [Streptomyces sp. adm13(2018)]TXS22418.1 hypothetical protein EAO70_06035 [Streptomyces sp. adm13(2018)]